MIDIDEIKIYWSGPHSVNKVIAENNSATDCGVYQIYGSHNIYGPDTLLYIGRTCDNTFGGRLFDHQEEWINWEGTPAGVYLGRIAGFKGTEEDDNDEWNSKIDRAERLLIYFCTPPYNSKNIVSYGEMKDTILFNYKQRGRIPVEVSTLYEKRAEEDPRG